MIGAGDWHDNQELEDSIGKVYAVTLEVKGGTIIRAQVEPGGDTRTKTRE